MEEIWKDIEGFEGLYQVSNMGRVKSLPRYRNCIHPYYSKEKILSPRVCGEDREYLSVALCENYKRVQVKIHRLVALAFIDNPNHYTEVNHKNEIKWDNRADNLEWCSRSYNVNYGKRIEKQRRHLFKPVICLGLDGSVVNEYPSCVDASVAVGVDSSNITRACKIQGRVTAGYLWKYKTYG